MDVCGLWTVGHGKGSGQNRLSSGLWSEAQPWGVGVGVSVVLSQALDSSPSHPSASAWPRGPSPGRFSLFLLFQSPEGSSIHWAAVRGAQDSSLPGPLQGRKDPIMVHPTQTTRPKEEKRQAHFLLLASSSSTSWCCVCVG